MLILALELVLLSSFMLLPCRRIVLVVISHHLDTRHVVVLVLISHLVDTRYRVGLVISNNDVDTQQGVVSPC